MIVFGTRLFGKCDTIEGVGHVATRFFHINFVPLIPLGGFFVLEGSDDRGVEISVRGKSVLAAWTRAATFFGGVGMLVLGLMAGGVLQVIAGVLLLGLFIASYWLFASMSDKRRIQLMADTGLLQALLEQHAEAAATGQPIVQEPVAAQPGPAQPSAAYAGSFGDYQPLDANSRDAFGGYQPPAAGQPAQDEPVPFAEYSTAPQPR